MKDFRDEPDILETMSYCFERGYSLSQMERLILRHYPDSGITQNLVHSWISSRKFWERILAELGRERAERLWNLRQSYARTAQRTRYRPMTLDEFLARAPKPESRLRTGASHIRKVGFA